MNFIEAAFREGYKTGYENGGNDYAAVEHGCGYVHKEIKKKIEDDAWKESEALAQQICAGRGRPEDSARLVMLRAAEIAEKVGDNIGQIDPRTGELSEREMNRADGCYQAAERLRVEAHCITTTGGDPNGGCLHG